MVVCACGDEAPPRRRTISTSPLSTIAQTYERSDNGSVLFSVLEFGRRSRHGVGGVITDIYGVNSRPSPWSSSSLSDREMSHENSMGRGPCELDFNFIAVPRQSNSGFITFTGRGAPPAGRLVSRLGFLVRADPRRGGGAFFGSRATRLLNSASFVMKLDAAPVRPTQGHGEWIS